MSRFVRSSKYRHVFGSAPKVDESYSNLNISKNSWDSNYAAVNGSYLALCWQTGGGGSAGVIRLSSTGRVTDVAQFEGHSGPVLDVAFSPFNENILATASEDSTVKIWQIDEQCFGNRIKNASQVLGGHNRKVGSVNFNPVANNVLATSSIDLKVKAWDIEVGEELCSVDNVHSGNIQSVDWNYNGSLIATYCKDKMIRVVDPRANRATVEISTNTGVKGGRVIWLGSRNLLFFAGFNRNSERIMAVWDPSNYREAISEIMVDNSSGILMPFWDDSSSIIFTAGKGDGMIRYYEYVDDGTTFYYLSQYSSNNPQSGAAFLPKVYINVGVNEIDRIYKVLPSNCVEPISFRVPRKSSDFQRDLFPDAPGQQPSLDASSWANGSNADPILVSLEGGYVNTSPTVVEFKQSSTTANEEVEHPMTEAEMRMEIKRLTQRVTFLESEIAKRDARQRMGS